jgi:putative restriction endonuclease
MEELNISRQLFHKLVEQLEKNIAGLYVSETDKWCGIYQKGGKRFAYVLLKKTKPKIGIWCLGDVDYIHEKYGTKVKFKIRQETSGGFGKEFQINFVVENSEDIENVIPLLVEVSNSWSRDELISAFNLYCKIPVDEISIGNAQIIDFSNLLGKTPKEIVRRFINFSKIESKNIEGVGADEKATWIYFNKDWEKLVHESEERIIDFENKLKNITNFPKGKERESIVKSRINQTFFRNAVLTSYEYKCCITGLPLVDLLNASHIVPWSVDAENRLNPHNGLCLNALHDRAFDRGLITVRSDYTIDVSSKINRFLDNKSIKNYFLCFKNKKIILPQRFIPEKSFLEFHNNNIFIK